MWTADGRFVNVDASKTVILSRPTCSARVTPIQNLPLTLQRSVIIDMIKPQWYDDDATTDNDKVVWDMVYNRWNGGPNLMFVAWQTDEPLGCVGVDHSHTDCGTAMVSHLLVSPAHRNRCVATRLMEIVDAHVKDAMQHTRVVLYCDPDLERFYERFGYERWDVKNEKVVMGKMLDSTLNTCCGNEDQCGTVG